MSTSDVSNGSDYSSNTVRDNDLDKEDTNEDADEEEDYENKSRGRGSGGGSVINGYIDRGGSNTEDSRQITDQKRNSGESDSGNEEQEQEGVRGFSRRRSPHSSPIKNESSLRSKIKEKGREKNKGKDTDEDEDSGVDISGDKNFNEAKEGRNNRKISNPKNNSGNKKDVGKEGVVESIDTFDPSGGKKIKGIFLDSSSSEN